MTAVVLAVVLLCVSGLVSASEIAFFSLAEDDLDKVDEGKSVADRRIRSLLDDSEHLLATILISNNVVNVAIVLLFACFFFDVVHWAGGYAVEFVLLVAVLVFLLLLFGESCPAFIRRSIRWAFAGGLPRCFVSCVRCSGLLPMCWCVLPFS